MKIIFKKFKEEEGAALIIALLVLTVLSLLGAVGILTSSMEMKISGNEKSEKIAFYNAEAGISEVIALFEAGTIDDSGQENSTIWVGAALGTAPTTAGFGASDYTYGVEHKLEDSSKDSAHCSFSNCSTETVVFYNVSGYKYLDAAINCNGTAGYPQCGFPVYEIRATGTSGTSTVTLVAEFSKNTLNLDVEAGLYAETADINGSATVNGPIFTGSTSGSDFAGYSTNVSTGIDIDMSTFLGVPTSEFPDFADLSYLGVSGNFNTEAGDWNGSTVADPVLVYVDNAASGAIQITSNMTGAGILVVTGDLNFMGTVTWDGLIYVMGTIDTGAGNFTVNGALMANEVANIGGNVTANYDSGVLSTLSQNAFGSKTVAWQRLY